MNRTSSFRRMAILLAAFLLALPLQAGTKKVRAAIEDSNIFLTLDKNGKPVSGFAYEYIQTIAAYANWDVEYVQGAGFVVGMQNLVDGKLDLLYDVSYTPERAGKMLYPERPMGYEEYYLYCLGGNRDIRSLDYSTFDGKRVGVTRGTLQVQQLKDWCRKKGISMKFVEYEAIPDKEAALESGIIDLDLEVSMLANSKFSAIEKIGETEYYLVTNLSRPDLIEDMNIACKKIQENDKYFFTHLVEKYYSKTVVNSTLSNDEFEWLAAHDTLTVGFLDDYMPLCDADKDGRPVGIVTDIVPLLMENIGQAGAHIKYVAFKNNAEMYEALSNGVDVVFPVFGSTEYGVMNNVLLSTDIIRIVPDVVYNGAFTDKTMASIAVNGENLLQDYYTKIHFPEAEIVNCSTIEECLQAVRKGKAGATILNGIRTSKLLLKEGLENMHVLRLQDPVDFCFAVKKGNTTLLSLLNRAIASTDDSAAFNFAYNYLDSQDGSFRAYFKAHRSAVILFLAIALAIVIIIVIYVNRRNRKLAAANKEILEQRETISKAMNAAEAANKAKTNFLFNMSHDIRTPMNAILGYTDVAIRHYSDEERTKDSLRKIKSSGEHLLHLINDILEMSRIESGTLDIKNAPTDLRKLIANVDNMGQALAIPKTIQFDTVIGTLPNPYVYADELHYGEVIINLVSNAMKYTAEDGRVTYQVSQLGAPVDGKATYRFIVSDNGIGMSQDFQQHLFDAFAREKTATVSKQQGVGLGLSIVKRIVDLAGGTILVKSGIGEGSTFTVDIPLRIMDEKAIAEYRKTHTDDEVIRSDVQLAGRRVLLVEDNVLNREIAEMILTESGLVIETAEDGDVAVNTVQQRGVNYFDFILMDIQMPRMNGYDATKAIRALPGGQDVPIIAVSANAFDEDIKKSLEVGMNAHIAKPIDIHELFKAMHRYMK